MIGIYRIRNLLNNKCYYGSAKNIKIRWTKHKSQLKHNRHENIILQRAWDKYGKDNFIFEICEEIDLLLIEQKYLDLNPEYNIGIHASGGDNLSKHPNRNEIINKIKTTLKIKCEKMSEDEIKLRFSYPKEKNPNWKGGELYKYCKCGVKIAPKSITCRKCVPREGENNPFYNMKHTDETKKKSSEKMLGKYNGSQNIKFTIDSVEYFSLGDASNKLNIPITTIRWRLKSKNIKFINYQYI